MRLTKSVCFAIEMVRSCLPMVGRGQYALTGMWQQMNMETEGDHDRLVSLLIHILGAPSQVQARCRVSANQSGDWDRGQCTITLTNDPSRSWTFFCLLNDAGKLLAFGTDDWIKWLELDGDVVDDLNAAGIMLMDELLELTEFQVCQIFQPKGPEVMAHPNPTGYIDEVTFDKFERLRAKLDARYVKLAGRRHELHELQSQL